MLFLGSIPGIRVRLEIIQVAKLGNSIVIMKGKFHHKSPTIAYFIFLPSSDTSHPPGPDCSLSCTFMKFVSLQLAFPHS